MAEPPKFENGKPTIPILNEKTLPKFLESARVEKAANRNNSRIKLFSGSANSALSQVNQSIQFYFVEYIVMGSFADGKLLLRFFFFFFFEMGWSRLLCAD